MAGENLALVRGIDDTRATLARWNREPWPPLRGWLIGALAITVALLVAVGVIASVTTPDDTPILLPGLNAPGDLGSVLEVLRRNALVLALHGFACVAGFIAGSSMPLEAERYSGLVKKVHDAAGPLAIAFVGAATAFSLITQAYVLGGAARTSLCIVEDPSPTVEGASMAGTLQDVSDTNFQAEVIESDQPVLVDFWAPWCGPCRVVAPVLEELAGERSDLRIVKLNVDENQRTAAQFGVLSIPTMILFKNGTPAKTIVGAYPKRKIESELSPALA